MTRIKQERAGRTYELQVSVAMSAFISPRVGFLIGDILILLSITRCWKYPSDIKV